jgi:hypothetical protein
MKRFFAMLMTVAFLGTTAMVMADDATPVATPAAKPMKKHHHKKAAAAAAVATPVVATTPAAK